jgi:hypothetical protein
MRRVFVFQNPELQPGDRSLALPEILQARSRFGKDLMEIF